MSVQVTFWGVRGSIACPSPQHVIYGGNTSCVQVTAAGRQLILDAGTGIRPLGQQLLKEQVESVDLLLTHTHWDHINGFPFFAPSYNPEFAMRIYAGHLTERGGVRLVLESQMSSPMFPVPLDALKARVDYHNFLPGQSFSLGDGISVRTAPLNHPNGAVGYRLECEGHVVCYVTDTEHTPGQRDTQVLDLITGADLFIYDSTYTDVELPRHVGWGHSTWEEGMRLARAAGVNRLVVFHHDPEHTDDIMADIESQVLAADPRALVARDGMRLVLDDNTP